MVSGAAVLAALGWSVGVDPVVPDGVGPGAVEAVGGTIALVASVGPTPAVTVGGDVAGVRGSVAPTRVGDSVGCAAVAARVSAGVAGTEGASVVGSCPGSGDVGGVEAATTRPVAADTSVAGP